LKVVQKDMKSSKGHQRQEKRLITLKFVRGFISLCPRRMSSVERSILVSCAEILRGRDGWSKFFEDNSRIFVSCHISQRGRGDTASIP
jgi:hypothetical protein